MWITSTAGFYSAVQDPDDVSGLVVRTRDYESLQMLVDGVETLTGSEVRTRSGGGTDYPHRAYVSKADFGAWLAFEVEQYIDYSNFKNEVAKARGAKWSKELMAVWVAMKGVEDDA